MALYPAMFNFIIAMTCVAQATRSSWPAPLLTCHEKLVWNTLEYSGTFQIPVKFYMKYQCLFNSESFQHHNSSCDAALKFVGKGDAMRCDAIDHGSERLN
ncbi:hypothetical protein HI914_00280 [Erysiphe necator]|nr:hypothetical protein HI914_00280 [Erysiphe necator]